MFFGGEHLLHTHGGLPSALSYAAAAALAMTLDFPVDAAVKRGFAAAPTCAVPSPLAEASRRLTQQGLRSTFRGLSAKAGEFTCSYFVTGAVSGHVVKLLLLAPLAAASASGATGRDTGGGDGSGD